MHTTRMVRLGTVAAVLALTGTLDGVATVWAAEPQKSGNTVEIDPLDWPHWRGPEWNGISREKGLVSKWSPRGENVLWAKPELATRSTPIIMHGKLYVLCRNHPDTTEEGEYPIVLFDARDNALDQKFYDSFGQMLDEVLGFVEQNLDGDLSRD